MTIIIRICTTILIVALTALLLFCMVCAGYLLGVIVKNEMEERKWKK